MHGEMGSRTCTKYIGHIFDMVDFFLPILDGSQPFPIILLFLFGDSHSTSHRFARPESATAPFNAPAASGASGPVTKVQWVFPGGGWSWMISGDTVDMVI